MLPHVLPHFDGDAVHEVETRLCFRERQRTAHVPHRHRHMRAVERHAPHQIQPRLVASGDVHQLGEDRLSSSARLLGPWRSLEEQGQGQRHHRPSALHGLQGRDLGPYGEIDAGYLHGEQALEGSVLLPAGAACCEGQLCGTASEIVTGVRSVGSAISNASSSARSVAGSLWSSCVDGVGVA